nr:LysR family transcriptional regulator [Shewanella indica]
MVLLKTFVQVIDSQGFTAAAEALHLAQSTISAHVKRLESQVGTPPPCVRIVVASVFRTIGRGAEVRFEWDIILKRIKKQSLVS